MGAATSIVGAAGVTLFHSRKKAMASWLEDAQARVLEQKLFQEIRQGTDRCELKQGGRVGDEGSDWVTPDG